MEMDVVPSLLVNMKKNSIFGKTLKNLYDMTFIANPIYDVVFKFMMEDDRVAKLLLSALLKKEIIQLELRPHEYISYLKEPRISLLRMDFAARIRDTDGTEHLVIIELQKTWLTTETLRFRQYLGSQYLNNNNMRSDDNSAYALPIISIYILGHIVGDLKEPVVYVRRQYLDYDDEVIDQKDPFVESLTHDSIIIQIPHLKGRTRNRLERLLNVFDQDYRTPRDEHLLEIDENIFPADEQVIITRLLKAGVAPDVRREMDIEDEILSEIEKRDTAILQREQVIEQKDQVIEQKDQVIEQKEQVIEQKEQVIEQKDQVIEQKEQMIEQKDQQLEQKDQMIEQQKAVIGKTVRVLAKTGMSVEDIAQQLSIPLSEVERSLS